MYHDEMDISAYILIKLIGTACAWKEDIWQYNILFCILTVGKHGTDARIQEFSSGGGGRVQVSLTKKLWQRFFQSSAYFTEVKWSISKKSIVFQGSRWGPIFSRGSNFFQGVSNCLYHIEIHLICDFPEGVRTPCPPPPLDPHLVQPSQLHG